MMGYLQWLEYLKWGGGGGGGGGGVVLFFNYEFLKNNHIL
jgi:hypothetical protein